MSTSETGGRVVIRRTFHLRLDQKNRQNQEVAQLCIRQDWIWITEAEARSAEDTYGEPGNEEEKTSRLNEAVASYLADTSTHSILGTQFWAADTSFPIEEAGQVVANFNQGLNDLLTQEARSLADWTGVPFPLDGMVAGITANFMLEEPEKYLRNASEVFWVIGLMAGLATGNMTLAIGCAKALAKDVIKKAVSEAVSTILPGGETSATDGHDATSEPARGHHVISKQPRRTTMPAGGLSLSPEALRKLREAAVLFSGAGSSSVSLPRDEESDTLLSGQVVDGGTLLEPPTEVTRAAGNMFELGPAD